jgi:hypothetical protein
MEIPMGETDSVNRYYFILFQYRLAQEVAELSDEAKAVELLHQAAYRTGLGNSIYSPVHMVSSFRAFLNIKEKRFFFI